MELTDIIEVNELFSPMYGYVAGQVLAAYGRDDGTALELGPFASGVAIELARRCDRLRLTVGDDFPGVTAYFERKVRDAGLAERIRVLPLNKLDLDFPEDSFDLVVFRGGLFFWDESQRIVEEAYRVLKSGGLAMVGGGFGAEAPDELIDSIATQSRDLNRKLGKRVLTETELKEILRAAGLDGRSAIDKRHGLWAVMRKG
ncbi:MAG: class I SAM-dependent methyltransferase [Chloroflexi bacterium]|nr:class I SAM-dependent methyltransferase [Chloroflexota bacterium]